MPRALRDVSTALLLAAAIAIVYAPVRHHGFVDYDDDEYVVENAMVRPGLTAAGVAWAFTAAHAANWHPLTWVSHMVDCSLFGLDAGRHHVTSVLLHAASAAILYLVLVGATGSRWRSLLVATVFGLHPLRVESVAWVAERKDVLAGLCWMLALAAYLGYAKRRSAPRYALVALAFVAGLLAKPMVVTLPFVLLLLDAWPLRRAWSMRLVAEKLPLLALAVAASVVTFVVQRAAGAMASVDTLPIGQRVANALVAYASYVRKTFLPVDLAVFYPLRPLGGAEVAGAAALLVAITGAAAWQAGRRPHLLVGWLWFLGTLVPVIGLVKVGDQAMADRFTYLPQIGLLLMLAWSLPERAAAAGTMVLGVACALLTARELPAWHDSFALFRTALERTRDNHVAEMNLGAALVAAGRAPEALPHLEHALALRPGLAKVHLNLGAARAATGDAGAAARHYEEALRLDPVLARAHLDLGLVRAAQGDLDSAIGHYRAALALDTSYVKARVALGQALAQQGHLADAVGEYDAALALAPDSAAAHGNLALALETLGRNDEALRHHREAARLAPDVPHARYNLAASLAAAGRTAEAMAVLREALVLRPDWPEARRALADLEAHAPEARP